MAAPREVPGHLDVLVLGSGVAGLSAAVRAAAVPGLKVGVLTKGELSQSATRWAQGGVAAVLGGDEDSIDLHMADTLAAGAGLCDRDAVAVLVGEGPSRVHDLIAMGAVFDRRPEGDLALAREGGHSMPRVVHAGGAATGAEIERALVEAVRATATAILEQWFSVDLIVEAGRCAGVSALGPDGTLHRVGAANVLLASGGAGQLFAVTTNPREATGDGIAMAIRAGAAVADVEFMQFHPTALHHPAMPRPLLSEALRGHGALLRDSEGNRFVHELSPRDAVSRAMASRMQDQGVEHLWLDATALDDFERRFPTIAGSLSEIGLDPSRDWLPIAPAAHYVSGGVVTDLDGASTLPGLWAAGEAACTGVHGANRLASNSLLEGMVFGARVVEAIQRAKRGPDRTGAMRSVTGEHTTGEAIPGREFDHAMSSFPGRPGAGRASAAPGVDAVKARERLQSAMTAGAGVVRNAASLSAARSTVEAITRSAGGAAAGRAGLELENLLAVAEILVAAADIREESRGAHTRSDFLEADERFRVRLVPALKRVGR